MLGLVNIINNRRRFSLYVLSTKFSANRTISMVELIVLVEVKKAQKIWA